MYIMSLLCIFLGNRLRFDVNVFICINILIWGQCSCGLVPSAGFAFHALRFRSTIQTRNLQCLYNKLHDSMENMTGNLEIKNMDELHFSMLYFWHGS